MEKCQKWLRGYLSRRGCVLVEQLKTDAGEEGFSKDELKAARKVLGVKTFHQFDEGVATDNWFWFMPDEDGLLVKKRNKKAAP